MPDETVLFSGEQTLEAPYQLGGDPRPLQLAFARLFDEAAKAVHRAGSDLDEVLVDRILVARDGNGHELEVRAEFLADAESLKRHVLGILRRENQSETWQSPQVILIRLVARLDA